MALLVLRGSERAKVVVGEGRCEGDEWEGKR